ncbi:TPA: dTDP-glucose 4,6-dehydratase [Bacillus toyonensis]|uniref:dTDP-glucose 4,6-dehydratase n=1 Tax=Bacillus toyonensis TaxID=155322 RepID=UPI000BEFF70A|nr:dTDP-glucose 4,6-dehydratase [Bacillus toyonensis]PEO66123.1 dTDP-glucose 4,6-dehydratase [Bacillus toyonensis]PFX76651.1 dTDP-glucose 4,6-dehydratase [Bacillus toyonensis]PFX95627.1 dTDP-glucose 4,6-dehydratase [Bacillus toyonensis]PGB20568.1 dTDP-glucose 4,6-dehydratase [Bacillus toyonensis]PHB57876.1 dTDP-glucose 4,6-dehydratase [Bacillus toyonensis]
MTTILLTGGAGFIGSNLVEYMLGKYPNYKIVNLDALTYAGDSNNLNTFKDNKQHIFVRGDIRNKVFLEEVFKKYRVQHVVHLAAESHVDNSIKNPSVFAETNVLGTLNLLEVARNYWMEKPFKYKLEFTESRFHHISTDEVYGTLGKEGYFTEDTNYQPNSPYSASKASSDFFVRSYYHTYGLNVVTTNCSNNYGPKQHEEKLIPTIIRKALKNENIPIYGNGENVRDWLYVEDHCIGLDMVFHKGKVGENYNIGGNNERTNNEIVHTICSILDKMKPKSESYLELITYVEDRHGHDFRYAIDASKVQKELGWTHKISFEIGLENTIKWYLNNKDWE